ncbi:MAG TPA: hypothetical protein VMW56_11125 [Candidatus Margulisiibacteriota bacterium]|nr:hypothetical protein [Candidatus Margulisiibacteriota bacterium]
MKIADVAGAIDQVATRAKASKTTVVSALLNEGLIRAAKRLQHALFILLLVLLLAPVVAHARTMCMILTHGKGLYNLVDQGWAVDYWMNGQFQSIAQPCGGMPVLITHADGTYGRDVAFDRAYCGCGITSDVGCDSIYVPQAGKTDPGITGPWPTGWWNGWVNETNADPNPDPTNQCVKSGPYWPRIWSVPGQYQGVLEQINRFLDQTGCDDAYVVTHSNGGNIIRNGLSQTERYLSVQCRQGRKAGAALDPGCTLRRQHQLRVFNTISHVLMLHPPSLGSEAANKAATLSGSWYTGWVLDWIHEPYDRSTQELVTSAMYNANNMVMYGTASPLRPWPVATSDGIPLHPIRWITFVSHLTSSQVIEENAHDADWELAGLAAYVQFPNDYSDGMVSWPSMAGVFTNGSTDIWYFTGQHDTAAAATTNGSYVGNNHYHSKLGAAGGGRWRPVYWYQQPTLLAAGVSPPLQGPGSSQCWQANENGTLVTYCPGWPSSAWLGVAVPTCPDAMCKPNQVRGSPAGGDEAFSVSAFIQAKAANYCGPAITQQSVQRGQSTMIYRLQYAGPGLFNPYWQPAYSVPLYDTYYPNAGMGICNWAC